MKINGKDLIITPASFDEAFDLKDSIENAIKEGKISIDIDLDSESISDMIKPESVGSLINSVLSVDSSKEVRKNLFICAERALLGTDKINKDFFEKVENREHYYKIMFEIMRVNLSPFFKGLFSKLSGLDMDGMIKSILKLK